MKNILNIISPLNLELGCSGNFMPRYIVDRKLAYDGRHIRDVIEADYFGGEVFLVHFCNGLHPQTLTLLLAIMLILGKC